ncbi:MAG: type II toxin-antitoxin system HicB family antitoxin [Leptolyngbyaceae bacterium]|nr:type II toxin-antitoxin system HicB family antitoxin [Leptolyngbyaceae bacterium]
MAKRDQLWKKASESPQNLTLPRRAGVMALENYNFDGFVINLYVDDQGDWLTHFQEIPTISAFGDTRQEALEELKTAWELVKKDYREKNQVIPKPQEKALSSQFGYK